MIRVVLPQHLRTLANVSGEVELEPVEPVTIASALDALESRYPVLSGTIRDYATRKRRPFLRFYACEEDLSNRPLETALPDAVASGKEPLLIIGAIAIPILLFLLKVGWPRIKGYFNQGLDDLEQVRPSQQDGVAPGQRAGIELDALGSLDLGQDDVHPGLHGQQELGPAQHAPDPAELEEELEGEPARA